MDLTRLRPVFEHSGPYLTVHADVGRASEDALDRIEARWTNVRHALDRFEAEESVAEELDRALRENTRVEGEARRTVVATKDEVLLDELQIGGSHWPEVLDEGELPDVAAWVAMEDRATPFVLVVADRTGADIACFRALSETATETETVTGETFYITKVPHGGWSQQRFQQAAEENWEQNARLVADEVRSQARRHGTRIAFVAGEVRARSEVTKAIEAHDLGSVGRVVEIESGGRAEGASDEAMWTEIRERLAEVEREADAEVAGLLEEARGRGEGAATGLDEVLDALRKAQVDRLVLDLHALADKTVSADDLRGVPLPAPAATAKEIPADRALLAAGALTGAQVSVVPASLARGGGVSALLRWSDTAD